MELAGGDAEEAAKGLSGMGAEGPATEAIRIALLHDLIKMHQIPIFQLLTSQQNIYSNYNATASANVSASGVSASKKAACRSNRNDST